MLLINEESNGRDLLSVTTWRIFSSFDLTLEGHRISDQTCV